MRKQRIIVQMKEQGKTPWARGGGIPTEMEISNLSDRVPSNGHKDAH